MARLALRSVAKSFGPVSVLSPIDHLRPHERRVALVFQRKPAQLCGGQRQRVALGRAMVRHRSGQAIKSLGLKAQ